MKKFWSLYVLGSLLLLTSCSKDDVNPDEIQINHVGEKWNITSATYTIISQKSGSQAVKIGVQANAGAFYFDGTKGSFEFTMGGVHKEDYFGFNAANSPDVMITSIVQAVSGASVSQNVITLSGAYNTTTTMELTGTIIKQTQSSQFSFTGDFQLTKE